MKRKNLRTVFMGTPEFAVPSLRALHKISDVCGVFTQPDRVSGRGLKHSPPPVKIEAERLGIPVFQPERLREPEAFRNLQILAPDLIVVAAYGQILREEVLSLAPHGCVNVHASLLPRWRGAAPIQWAILSGDTSSGVTLMQMERGLDTGPMLLKIETPLAKDETTQTLHDRLAEIGADLILKGVPLWVGGQLTPEKQQDALATHAPKIEKGMGVLDLTESAEILDRRIRALNPWPGTWIQVKGMGRLAIRSARVTPMQEPLKVEDRRRPELLEKAGSLLIRCGIGELEVRTVQWEGKKPADAASFLNGLHGRGARLPLELDPIWIT